MKGVSGAGQTGSWCVLRVLAFKSIMGQRSLLFPVQGLSLAHMKSGLWDDTPGHGGARLEGQTLHMHEGHTAHLFPASLKCLGADWALQ